MSLEALPTELDMLIFDCLTTQEKSRLARVSKSYHKTGVPLLYRSLRFYHDEIDSIAFLLLTLLRRRKVSNISQHVESFHLLFRPTKEDEDEKGTWESVEPPMVSTEGSIYEQLKAHAKLIKRAILHSGVRKLERVNWSQRLLQPNPKLDYVLALTVHSLAPLIDLTLAMDEDRPLHLTQEVLRTSAQQRVRPKSMLSHQALTKNLRIESPLYERNRLHLAIWPGLEEIVVKGCVPLFEVQPTATMKKLELDFCHNVSSFLAPLLQDNAFRNLESLSVQGAKFQPKTHVNCDHFKNYILKNLKALREFVWLETKGLDEVTSAIPFGTFRHLNKLEVLRLDYNLFPARYCGRTMPKFGFPNLSPDFDRLADYLPPSMRTFELHGLDWRAAGFPFPAGLDTQSDDHAHDMSAVHGIRKELQNLQEVIFTVNMDHPEFYKASQECPMYLDDKIIPYWREVADTLAQYGIHFKVQYSADHDCALKYPLVQPGYSTLKIWPRKEAER